MTHSPNSINTHLYLSTWPPNKPAVTSYILRFVRGHVLWAVARKFVWLFYIELAAMVTSVMLLVGGDTGFCGPCPLSN